MPAFKIHLPAFCVVVTAGWLVSCERVTETMPIEETREISSYTPSPTTFISSAQRFDDMQEQQQQGGSQTPPAELFDWITPPGWTQAPPATGGMGGMRLVDMRFGPNGEGECFLSVIQGEAGGLDANVNRWRTQMGQPPYTAEELAALPKKDLFGREAIYLDFEGDFKNVGQSSAQQGYRLLGLVQQTPQFTLFVKMTGPKDLVQANATAFEQFAQSISLKR